MNNQVLDGWLLHKRPHGDTSWDLIIFTRQYGKIDALYRGGRAAKKNTQVQLFTPLNLSVQQAYQRFYINKLEFAGFTYQLQNEALYCGWYINELLVYLLPLSFQTESLFELYTNTLEIIQNTTTRTELAIALRQFERGLIMTAGFAWWGVNITEFGPETLYNYLSHEGFIADSQGFISGKAINDIIQDSWNDPNTLKTSRKLFRIIIDELLNGRELHSRKLWQQTTYI